MGQAHSLFVQVIDGEHCQEGRLDDSGRLGQLRPVPLPRAHLTARFRAGGRLLDAHKRLLRLLVRSLYLCPLLLVPKYFLSVRRHPASDWITVAFVGLVLIFFLAVAVYLVLFAVAGPPSKRRLCGWRLRAGGSEGAELKLHEAAALLQRLVDGKSEPDAGPVRALGWARGNGKLLLSDVWAESDGRVLRVTWCRPLVVEQEGQPPIVIPSGVPVILSDYRSARPGSDDASLALRRAREALQLPPLGRCIRRDVEAGDWLDVSIPRYRVVPDFDEQVLEGIGFKTAQSAAEGSPYRFAAPRPGLIAAATDEEPVLMRVAQVIVMH